MNDTNEKHLTLNRSDLGYRASDLPFEDIDIHHFKADPRRFWRAEYIEFVDGDRKKVLKDRHHITREGIRDVLARNLI